MMRKPIVKLDNYEAYMSGNTIELPIDNLYDPFVYEFTHMIDNSDGLIYFEERYYSVIDYKISKTRIKLNIEEHKYVINRRKENKV